MSTAFAFILVRPFQETETVACGTEESACAASQTVFADLLPGRGIEDILQFFLYSLEVRLGYFFLSFRDTLIPGRDMRVSGV